MAYVSLQSPDPGVGNAQSSIYIPNWALGMRMRPLTTNLHAQRSMPHKDTKSRYLLDHVFRHANTKTRQSVTNFGWIRSSHNLSEQSISSTAITSSLNLSTTIVLACGSLLLQAEAARSAGKPPPTSVGSSEHGAGDELHRVLEDMYKTKPGREDCVRLIFGFMKFVG